MRENRGKITWNKTLLSRRSAAMGLCLVCCLLLVACDADPRLLPFVKSSLDLVNRFSIQSSPPETNRGSFDRHLEVIRKGRRLDAMVLVAPVAIRASLSGISGRALFDGFATPLFNIGDGIQMDVLIWGEGKSKLVYSRFYDAGRREDDRDWIPFSIPLELGDSKDNDIEIRVSAGPQGDLTDDWLAIGGVRIWQRVIQ